MDVMFIDFLNSDWRDWRGTGRPRENKLENREWMEAFLQKWGLLAPLPVDEQTTVLLVELRERMRQMVENVTKDKKLSCEQLAELNHVMELAPGSSHLSLVDGAYKLERKTSVTGWEMVMARVASSFADFLVNQELGRIKICDNPDCQWVYFDESKNRVRRWCDDKACGNLMKVRRFRKRQKEKGQDA